MDVLGFFTLFTVIFMEARLSYLQSTCGAGMSIQDDEEYGYALNGHTYSAITTASYTMCWLQCEDDPKCMSLNYDTTTQQCYLNNQNKMTQPSKYVMKHNSYYRTIANRKPKDLTFRMFPICSTIQPCRSGSTCIDGKGNYTCLCKKGMVGYSCEIALDNCYSQPCQHGGQCINLRNTFYCTCPVGYGQKRCWNEKGFTVVNKVAVTYNNEKYLAIEASLGSSGLSVNSSWCEDYYWLCKKNDARPVGCGRSYDNLTSVVKCRDDHRAIMQTGDPIGCNSTDNVAAVVMAAGLNATRDNSFAFGSCDETCPRQLEASKCVGSLPCLKLTPDLKVFTICSKFSDSGFMVRDERDLFASNTTYKFLEVQLQSGTRLSRHESWCRDYQRLCESYGLRPVAFSKEHEYKKDYGTPGRDYHAIVEPDSRFGTHSNSRLYALAPLVGFKSSVFGNTFAIVRTADNYPCTNTIPSSSSTYGLYYFNYNQRAKMYTACSNGVSVTLFKVLTYRNITFQNIKFLALKTKVQTQVNRQNWCKEYQSLCESFNMQPIGCSADYKYIENTQCRDEYRGLAPRGDVLGCPPYDKATTVLNMAGFSDANINNTFVFHECDQCTGKIPSDCSSGYVKVPCIGRRLSNQVAYTLCAEQEGAFSVLSSYSTSRENVPFLTLHVRHLSADSKYDNWCTEYKELCALYSMFPTGCGTAETDPEYEDCNITYSSYRPINNILGCPPAQEIYKIARSSGYESSRTSNSFGFSKCLSNCKKTLTTSTSISLPMLDFNADPRREAYTVCQGPPPSFGGVLDTNTTIYNNQKYHVMKLKLPGNGKSLQKNWCKEYQMLCKYYGLRPTGCGKSRIDDEGVRVCRDDYDSIVPEADDLGCDPRSKVSEIAISAGFTDATTDNSFAFFNCSDCPRILPSSGCTGGLYCLNRTIKDHVYTVCRGSDSNFIVRDSTTVDARGTKFLVLKTEVPENYQSKHETWCVDYKNLCKSYGKLPTGLSRNHLFTTSHLSLCKTEYQSVMLREGLQISTKADVDDLVKQSNIRTSARLSSNFAFADCRTGYCVKKITTASNYALPGFSTYNSFRYYQTICVNPDCNFGLIDTRNYTHNDRNYLVIHASVPEDGVAKYEDWCIDYQRLCQSFNRIPVTCGEDSWRKKDSYKCRDQYGAALVSALSCDNTDAVAIAKGAGFQKASRSNTLTFHNCRKCSKYLEVLPNEALYPLSRSTRKIYAICTDSNSNFEVLETRLIDYKGVPHLAVLSRTPADGYSRHANWCRDYERMCATYGQHPTGCSIQHNSKPYVKDCETNYSSSMPLTDIFGCYPSTQIQTAVSHVFKTASRSNTFGFYECSSASCSNLLPDPSYKTLRSLYYSNRATTFRLKHTVCVDRRPAFQYISHDEYRKEDTVFLVIKVKIPTDGKSRFENWCRDYEKLCSLFARRPLGCGAEFLVNPKNKVCRDEYNAVMPSDNMLGCPPNRTALAEIAIGAGYTNATTSNVFAMKECNSCSDTIPSAGHINNNLFDLRLGVPNREAYAVCVDSDSNFRVFETKPVVYGGWKYLAVKAQLPADRRSQHLNWCRDYQRMCESFGKRPMGLDTSTERYKSAIECKLKYNAVFPDSKIIWSIQPYTHVFEATKKAGMSIASQFAAFAFLRCAANCEKLLQAQNCQNELQCMSMQSMPNRVGYTLCVDPDSGFKDPSTRTAVYEGVEYLVITATVTLGSKSRHIDWCKDYQKMCESYGRRPLGCGASYGSDRKHLRCRDRYNALMFYEDTSFCHQNERVAKIAKYAGFPLANENNSFAFNSCEKSDCPQIFGTRSTRAFYNAGTDPNDPNIFTVCVNSDSNLHVMLAKPKNEHIVVKARIPNHGISKYKTWCHDYERMCASYGLRPATSDYRFLEDSGVTSCRSKYNAYISNTRYIESPPKYQIQSLSNSWSDTTSATNSFAFYKCNEEDCHSNLTASGCSPSLSCISKSVPDKTVHTICTESTKHTNFKVLDSRKSKFMNGQFLVIKAIINDANGASLKENWCTDYKILCESYGKRPLACPMSRATGHSYHRCREEFKAVMMEVNECPLNRFVAHMAHSVGFHQATESNSFAFRSCNESTCVKYLNRTGCDDSLYCISRNVPYGEVYTVCVNSPTNFEVIDSKWRTLNQIDYLAIKLRLPTHGKPLQKNWCREYQVLCESYNARPNGCKEDSKLSNEDSQTCSLNYNNLFCLSRTRITYLIATNFYTTPATVTINNTFVLSGCSREACSQDLTTSSCHSSLSCMYKGLIGKDVYTMCAKSKYFDVQQTKRYVYQGIPYLVIKARLPSHMNSKKSTWCGDYQSLCDSYHLKPTGCGMMHSNDTAFSTCSSLYGSIMLPGNQLGCDPRSMVSIIARQAGFYNATADNSFAFHRCAPGDCTSTLPSTGCSNSLSCAGAKSRHLEVYTLCTSTPVSNFEVMDTSYVLHMGVRFLTLRARLPLNGTSLNDNWCEDYRRLCEVYDGRPVGCGASNSQNPAMSLCGTKYDSFTSKADLFGCGSTHLARMIIQKGELKGVTDDNVFVFHKCDKHSCTKKFPTAECSKSLHCLKKNILPYEAFTLCLANEQYHHFEVMNSKRTTHNNLEYEAFEVKIPKTKKSKNENWCRDYQRLCETNGMRPVGCNISLTSSNPLCQRYNPLALTQENPCSSTEFAKTIANKAGFSTATTLNSFAFDDCSTEKCPRRLDDSICQSEPKSSFCKLNNTDVGFTICVKAKTAFEVHETKNVAYDGLTFDVIKAKVPTGEDTQANWCMEYKNVCESYGLRPVVTHNIIDEYRLDSAACQDNYGAISIDFGRNNHPYTLANVAGFPNASKINSFSLSRCSNNVCNGKFNHTLCGTAFDCLKDKAAQFNFVYFFCLKHVPPSNFEVLATKDTQYSNDVHLVVQARLPFNGRSQHENWCRDYQELCKTYRLRPLSCNRNIYKTDNDKAICLGNYDAVMPIDDSLECSARSRVKELANLVGFNNATLSNSFALFNCKTCSNIVDSSVPNQGLSELLLSKDRVVYTVCTKDQSYNFDVLETRLTTKKNTEFLILKLNVPRYVSNSKNINWCKDYQMMCESYGRRPLGHASYSLKDGGEECEQFYNAYMALDDAFPLARTFKEDVEALIQSVGFSYAKHTNNNIFVFFECTKCKKSFDNPLEDLFYGISYLGHKKSSTQKYTVCV